MFLFRHSQQYSTAAPTVFLEGLDENAVYRLEPAYGKLSDSGESFSGAYLMHRGINPDLKNDYDSMALVLHRQ